MARGRTREQRADRMYGLAASANHTANIPVPELQFKDSRSAVGNFRQHHVVRKFDQLPNHELQKFPHTSEINHESAFAQHYGVTGEHE